MLIGVLLLRYSRATPVTNLSHRAVALSGSPDEILEESSFVVFEWKVTGGRLRFSSPPFYGGGAKVNTYEFTLERNDMRQSKFVRAIDLGSAEGQLDDELEAGWSIVSVLENGRPVSSSNSQ